jgi:hypothetical protein
LCLQLLLTREQRFHDVPQTMKHCLPSDYSSSYANKVEPVDEQIEKKLHPQHSVAKEAKAETAVTVGGVLYSVSISPYH